LADIYNFGGKIDEVKIYNYALSNTEVQAEYAQAAPSNCFTIDSKLTTTWKLNTETTPHAANTSFEYCDLQAKDYRVYGFGNPNFLFTVNADHTISYDPSLENFLDGNGTHTLTIQ